MIALRSFGHYLHCCLVSSTSLVASYRLRIKLRLSADFSLSTCKANPHIGQTIGSPESNIGIVVGIVKLHSGQGTPFWLVGLRRFRSAKKAQTITGQRVNLDL
ncbi:unknown protein [Microcystis aeruginosa NIES-843]|uniref:Uncharacterized protein n=1 Tax=Microcystis aeruginosa (strain NIES-843 / IAM M-2473) TaxID=449447 RepID=B0JRD2_MICAN|nr:unknown protein [Microcystis aeruginosa NIES-843]